MNKSIKLLPPYPYTGEVSTIYWPDNLRDFSFLNTYIDLHVHFIHIDIESDTFTVYSFEWLMDENDNVDIGVKSFLIDSGIMIKDERETFNAISVWRHVRMFAKISQFMSVDKNINYPNILNFIMEYPEWLI